MLIQQYLHKKILLIPDPLLSNANATKPLIREKLILNNRKFGWPSENFTKQTIKATSKNAAFRIYNF